MREGELLRRIFARSADLPREFPQVLTGPGDDCAVVSANGGHLLLKVEGALDAGGGALLGADAAAEPAEFRVISHAQGGAGEDAGFARAEKDFPELRRDINGRAVQG